MVLMKEEEEDKKEVPYSRLRSTEWAWGWIRVGNREEDERRIES